MTAANRDPAWGGSGGGGPATLPPVAELGDFFTVGDISIDPSGVFIDRNSNLTIASNVASPVSVRSSLNIVAQGKGDNATFIGISDVFLQVRDRSDVTAANKGVLYGLQISLVPTVGRDNSPWDDVAAIIIQHAGAAGTKATEAFFIGHNGNFTAGAPEYADMLGLYANADYAVRIGGTHQYGIDFWSPGAHATSTVAPIRIPNNTWIVARNGADSADIPIVKVASDNTVTLSPSGFGMAIFAPYLQITNTAGLMIANASNQKLAFWGATPIVRPTGWAAATNTKTRTTFDTTTVTLPVLAAHVGALLDDLLAEGLIGA